MSSVPSIPVPGLLSELAWDFRFTRSMWSESFHTLQAWQPIDSLATTSHVLRTPDLRLWYVIVSPLYEHIVDFKYCSTVITFTDEVSVQAVVELYLTATIVRSTTCGTKNGRGLKSYFSWCVSDLVVSTPSEDFPDGALL